MLLHFQEIYFCHNRSFGAHKWCMTLFASSSKLIASCDWQKTVAIYLLFQLDFNGCLNELCRNLPKTASISRLFHKHCFWSAFKPYHSTVWFSSITAFILRGISGLYEWIVTTWLKLLTVFNAVPLQLVTNTILICFVVQNVFNDFGSSKNAMQAIKN